MRLSLELIMITLLLVAVWILTCANTEKVCNEGVYICSLLCAGGNS